MADKVGLFEKPTFSTDKVGFLRKIGFFSDKVGFSELKWGFDDCSLKHGINCCH